MKNPTSPQDIDLSGFRSFALDAFQRDAIQALARGESVLVAAPTGAGKTVIAEFAIERALREGRRIIYTAPIKALSNQKYRDFSALHPGAVGITTGDVSINVDAPALIMTTEIFRNTIFESPQRLADVSTVIFDEIHFLDDLERGTVWEESLIFAPPEMSILALSATVSNLNEFAEWLRKIRPGRLNVIVETHRPIPLEIYLAEVGGGIHRYDEKHLRHIGAKERNRRRAAVESIPAHFAAFHRKLIHDIKVRGELPCLFFLFSREACERLAERCLDEDFFPSEAHRVRALEAFDELVALYRVEPRDDAVRSLRRLMGQGITYHHAGLLPVLKELVERLFSAGHVRLLLATETFALGVNMPARAVAFEGIRKFDGRSRVPLQTRQFLQMAGRAGRRGLDRAGSAYITYDPTFDDPQTVRAIVRGDVEPVRSRFNLSYATLLNLFEHLGSHILDACQSSFASFLMDRDERAHGRRPKKRERQQRHRPFRAGGGRTGDEALHLEGRAFRGMIAQVESKLDFLEELGYIQRSGDTPASRLTDTGRFASQIYGSEIPATELVFQGVLDQLSPERLAAVFTALVHDARPDPATTQPFDPRKLLGKTFQRATKTLETIVARETAHGIRDLSRSFDWRLTPAVMAWTEGAEFSTLRTLTSASDGDIVRTLRQAIQVMRMVSFPLLAKRDVIKPNLYKIGQRMNVAIDLIKRDLVDAEWQLRIEEDEERARLEREAPLELAPEPGF